MPSTFTGRLRFEKQANGENDSTWGTKLDTVLDLIDDSVAGMAAVVMAADADYVLTTNNSATDEARMAILSVTSGVALTVTRNITVPTQTKKYIVKNSTTGGKSLTVKTVAGTGITVPNGKTAFLACDGVNVINAFDYADTLRVVDANFVIVDDGDQTKGVKFQVSGVTTATTRILAVQDSDDTIVGRATTDTLTNKTLTNPANTTQALVDAATVSVDFNSGHICTLLATNAVGNTRAVGAPANIKQGGRYVVVYVQDATGGRAITWNAVFKGVNGSIPAPFSGANAITVYTFTSPDGTNLDFEGRSAQSKLINATRDLAAAPGSVSYTGTGFTPLAIIAFGSNTTISNNNAVNGHCDSALNQNALFAGSVTPGQWSFITGRILLIGTDAAYQRLAITSMDNNGFTGAWDKTGAPGGTQNISFLCFA